MKQTEVANILFTVTNINSGTIDLSYLQGHDLLEIISIGVTNHQAVSATCGINIKSNTVSVPVDKITMTAATETFFNGKSLYISQDDILQLALSGLSVGDTVMFHISLRYHYV